MTANPASATAGSASAGGDQLYVTHCHLADSLQSQAGFSVRAASLADPLVFGYAVDATSYELPMDMWSPSPRPQDAPVRLARLAGPDGRVALVHSVYKPFDTRGRPGSYFSHLLLCDRIDAPAALRAWAAPQWCTDYEHGAPRELPRLTALPRAAVVGDKALHEFLGPSPHGAGGSLAGSVLPERLAGDMAARRDLLARVALGVALVLKGPQPQRACLYLLAEPGLAALLLYGACRLLPAAWTAELTFSTFEPAHARLRKAGLAQVVATYLKDPRTRGLDDTLAARGYLLDTFVPERTSPELDPAQRPGLDGLVQLAADGVWGTVAKLQALLDLAPAEGTVLDHLDRVLSHAAPVRRLVEGQPTLADLVLLSKWEQGRSLLGSPTAALALFLQAAREVFKHRPAEGPGELAAAGIPLDVLGPLLQELLLDPAAVHELRTAFRAGNPVLWKALSAYGFRGLAESRHNPRAILRALLPGEYLDGPLIDRLLEQHPRIPPDVLAEHLFPPRAFQDREVIKFWLDGDRLGRLMTLLKRAPQAAQRIWEKFAGWLGVKLVLGDKGQRRLFDALWRAMDTPDAAWPLGAVADRLHAWKVLLDTFEAPGEHDHAEQDIDDACVTCGVHERYELLQQYYTERILPHGPQDSGVDHFSNVFAEFYPLGKSSAEEVLRITTYWLQIVRPGGATLCPDRLARRCLVRFVKIKDRKAMAMEYWRKNLVSAQFVREVGGEWGD